MRFDTAALTHVGIARAGRPNEDAFALSEDRDGRAVGLAVADGVGGAPGGDRASRAAADAFAARTPGADPPSALRMAIEDAAQAVRAITETTPELSGASTTIVFAYALDDRAWIANLGDSRAYHWHAGELSQVSVDHSWVQEQVDAGVISAAEARTHPRRNLITRALNADRRTDEAEYFEVQLTTGDRLLLCTDGLYGPIDDPSIEALLAVDASAAELAARLVDAALTAGAPDNVTVAVLRVTEAG